MQLIRSFQRLPAIFHEQGCALTVGNFDGVHLGHQQILRHLRQKADELALPMVVMLFEPQPREYFLADKAPARLLRLRDKLHYLAQAGVDYVFCIKFNRAFAVQHATDFISDYLVAQLNVKFLSIGDDFRFGAGREGDFALLQQAGKKYGFEVEDNCSLCLDTQRISSTAVRQALAEDNLALAATLLGKPYCIYGRVVHGNKLGRTIGFPTANIRLQRQVNPIKGVYAVKIQLDDGRQFTGVANVGKRPTLNGIKHIQLLEVHLFNFSQNLYGQSLQIEFCHKLRNEIKFASFEALKQQIEQDVIVAKAYFAAKLAEK
ncbi:riboflavin biosynthesis protein RibF [Actinobacillus seminis]|uniref:Riboflavin biosynthesis protein n=1 Tax=Actinobacillus seminis TaxID=722 RepID=A0A263HAW7_9PAST|nr:bifunctional riboflavin kinase/FAD synthetase [Actinobacillus seminis]OZN24049.1 riboflavin biosynthesis protein RibF [Actinobacillus seminis]SUU35462.1 bifunctional riboflavin kinase/FMN adenylyltransferase [Actinobacillus seminis]